MAAMPVGATTIIRFGDLSFNVLKNVVLPVPAFPVRKMFVPVLSTICHARRSSALCAAIILLPLSNYMYFSAKIVIIYELSKVFFAIWKKNIKFAAKYDEYKLTDKY